VVGVDGRPWQVVDVQSEIRFGRKNVTLGFMSLTRGGAIWGCIQASLRGDADKKMKLPWTLVDSTGNVTYTGSAVNSVIFPLVGESPGNLPTKDPSNTLRVTFYSDAATPGDPIKGPDGYAKVPSVSSAAVMFHPTMFKLSVAKFSPNSPDLARVVAVGPPVIWKDAPLLGNGESAVYTTLTYRAPAFDLSNKTSGDFSAWVNEGATPGSLNPDPKYAGRDLSITYYGQDGKPLIVLTLSGAVLRPSSDKLAYGTRFRIAIFAKRASLQTA